MLVEIVTVIILTHLEICLLICLLPLGLAAVWHTDSAQDKGLLDSKALINFSSEVFLASHYALVKKKARENSYQHKLLL